jgi:hypothetical protein
MERCIFEQQERGYQQKDLWNKYSGTVQEKNISSGLGRFKGKSWKIRMYMHKIGRIVLKRLKWGCNREGTTLFLEGRVPIKKSCCQSSNGSPNLQSIAAMAKSFVSWCTSRIDNDRGNLSQMPSQRIILSIHHIIHI